MRRGSRHVPAAGVVLLDAGKVLMVRHKEISWHKTGSYSFPAGKIEPGEEPREAAARELLEETGYKVRPEDLVEVTSLRTEIEGSVSTLRFRLTLFAASAFWGARRESIETVPEWFARDEAGSLPGVLPETAELIETAKHKLRLTY